jgi:Family of unknown function (DUF5977)
MSTISSGTILGLNIMTYQPTGFKPGQPVVLIISLPGAGEIGTNAALMLNAGPFAAALKPGVDLGLNVVCVEIQNTDQDPRPTEEQGYISALKSIYNATAIVVTGYSRSGQDWDWFAGFSEADLAEITAIFEISSEGPVADEPGIPGAWEPAWFLQSGVQWWGVCGDQDSFYNSNQYSMLPRFNALKAVAPNQAQFTVLPGVGHSAASWNVAYSVGGVKNAAGQDFWHWAASFGTAAVVTPTPVVVPPPPPTVYSSAVASQSFTRNNCDCGTGSAVTYTVPAGKYTSTVSQAAADAQANNDITANGQNYANANGTCTPLLVMDLQIFTDGSMIKTVNGVVTKIPL